MSDEEVISHWDLTLSRQDAEATLEELRKKKLEDLKLQVMAQNPSILGVPAPQPNSQEEQAKGRVKREPIEERWKTPESDEDISIPVRPRPGQAYDVEVCEARKTYEGRKPEYHFLPHQGQMQVRILPAAPNGMNGLNPNPWFTTQQLHYIPKVLGMPQTIPCNRILSKTGSLHREKSTA